MTPNEVKAVVEKELQQGWDEKDQNANPHGVQLNRCLLARPKRRKYIDSFNNNKSVDLWLVLEEDPVGHGGYEIVFDETCGEFGLATGGQNGPVFIGFYGSFRNTLQGM